MENSFPSQPIQLPPGFRFHPTDEELITHYLSPKLLDPSFSPLAIAHADFNKSEPWDLPWKAQMGEKEWYFFCVRDRKYPTGLRTNRATHAGYWKATGKDKEIFKAKTLIGKKKTLVFYRGRAPKGGKTNWVMHEYRLHPQHHHDLPSKSISEDWWGKKMMVETGACSELPPLMEGSPNQTEFGESSHVTCFSDPNRHQAEDPMTRDDIVDSQVQVPNSFQLENYGWGDLDGDISSVICNSNDMIQRSFQNQPYSSASAGPVDDDIGCLWNYST